MLTTYSTGGAVNKNEYVRTRKLILAQHQLKHLVPQFLKTCRSVDDFWSFIKGEFDHYQERRNFLREQFDPLLTTLEFSESSPAELTSSDILTTVDSEHVHDLWVKALERRSSDPEGAITIARTLLEAVCVHILDDLSVEYDDKADLPKLYSKVASHLNLSPSQHIEPIFKQILGGCHSVVQGLGALRSKLGDAHARGKVKVKPASRHAELAVNLAGTMATFLITTYESKQK